MNDTFILTKQISQTNYFSNEELKKIIQNYQLLLEQN